MLVYADSSDEEESDIDDRAYESSVINDLN